MAELQHPGGQAEVDEPDPVVAAQEDVVGLEVAVQQRRVQAVQSPQGHADLPRPLDQQWRRDTPHLGELAGEGGPGDVLHGEEGAAAETLGEATVVHVHEMAAGLGVRHGVHRLGEQQNVLEQLRGVLLGQARAPGELESHAAHRMAEDVLVGAEDRPETAAPDPAAQCVAAVDHPAFESAQAGLIRCGLVHRVRPPLRSHRTWSTRLPQRTVPPRPPVPATGSAPV